MPLSWNEIKSRAAAFSKEWEHDTSEENEDGHTIGTVGTIAIRKNIEKKNDHSAGHIGKNFFYHYTIAAGKNDCSSL